MTTRCVKHAKGGRRLRNSLTAVHAAFMPVHPTTVKRHTQEFCKGQKGTETIGKAEKGARGKRGIKGKTGAQEGQEGVRNRMGTGVK